MRKFYAGLSVSLFLLSSQVWSASSRSCEEGVKSIKSQLLDVGSVSYKLEASYSGRANSGNERLPLMASYCGRNQPLEVAGQTREISSAPQIQIQQRINELLRASIQKDKKTLEALPMKTSPSRVLMELSRAKMSFFDIFLESGY